MIDAILQEKNCSRANRFDSMARWVRPVGVGGLSGGLLIFEDYIKTMNYSVSFYGAWVSYSSVQL